MNYVRYNRSFVMMEEQNNQFAERESLPVKGYLKVETGNNKGALRCTVQNLRYYEKSDYIYKLILFGKKGERTIHTIIGNLLVNRQGNGETYFRFLPLDVDGKGNAYHYFTTAIIAAASTKDDREPLHPVLKGVTFSEGEPFQSELFQVKDELEEECCEEVDIAAASEEGTAANQPDKEKEYRPHKEPVQPFDKEPAQPFDKEPVQPSEKELEETAQPSEKEPEETAQPSEKEPEETAQGERVITKKDYNSFYNEYILNACIHTCRIARFYEDVNPFGKDKTGARWKKIVNITNLPLVSPGAHYFATQYRHYIFGAKPDEKGAASRFYFGIPGRFLDEEQPDAGRSGFTYWQPIRSAEPVFEAGGTAGRTNRNAYGYWIVAVDAKTGNIEEV